MAKSTTTALANYDKELAALAAMGAKTAEARAGSTAKTIGTEGARFKIDGTVLKELTMDVVITDFILVNTFYTPGTVYDQKNPTSPICYAYGRTEEEMVPHEESTCAQGGPKYMPKGYTPGPKDAPASCVNCWANQWESAEKGKGKACKNGTRQGLITADSLKSAEAIEDADVRFLSTPPTSGVAWAKHVDSVMETFKKPILAVVTQVEIGPRTGGGHELYFSTVEEVNPKLIGALLAKHKETAKDIDYPFFKAEPGAEPKGGKKQAAKAPARAQSSRPSSKSMGEASATPRSTKY